MTQDEIIAMASEAGIEFQCHVGVLGRPNVTTLGSQKLEKIQRLIELAVAKEREAWRASLEPAFRIRMGSEQVREIVQSAIRARGQKEGA